MKIKSAIAIVIAIIGIQNAAACSLATSDIFQPNLQRWEKHPGPKQKDSKSSGEYWESVPAPIVKVSRVIRGTSSDGGSCEDAGTIELEISLPKESTYSLNNFGIYFRVKSGQLPDEIFPDVPVSITEYQGSWLVSFGWLDGHPKYQKPLDIEVEAFLVSNGMNIGPSTLFRVTSGVGKG